MANEKFIRRLPGVFQTDPNKKFFASTVDQLFSKRNSESLNGFIGRREGGTYQPLRDFFINEQTRDRMNYQLEPIAVTRDPDTLENANEVFYEDILNRIRFYGGNISNHDRLFGNEYYSFAPPIDIDKFVNYQNYFWIPERDDVPVLEIPGLTDFNIETNILGKKNFATLYELEQSEVGTIIFDVVSDENRIFRSVGSWLTDPIKIGDVIKISNSGNNDGFFKIEEITEKYLVVFESIVSEGPIVVEATKLLSPFGDIIFDQTSRSITRTIGSWSIDGVRSGDVITITNAAQSTNNGSFEILTVSGATISLTSQSLIVNEGPSSGVLINVTRTINVNSYLALEFSSADDSLSRRNGSWDLEGIESGDTIAITNSISNDGLYTVTALASSIPGTLNKMILSPSVTDEIPVEINLYNPLDFSSGMVLSFPDSTSYTEPHQVELVGRGIILVPFASLTLPTEQFEFLLWDFLGDSDTNTGPEPWDSLPWDVIFRNLEKDYITIERGSCDNNAWSRTNSWYHKDVLSTTSSLSGEQFPSSAQRARRPIIEFTKDLELFNSGKKFAAQLKATSTDEFGSVDGMSIATTLIDGTTATPGDLIVFLNESALVPTANDFIWEVGVDLSNNIVLSPFASANEGDIVFAIEGNQRRGLVYYYDGSNWLLAENQKTSANQPPLFQLYDCDGVELNDDGLYPQNNFNGSQIFSYKVNTLSTVVDNELGFPLEFKSLGQISDIVFEHDLEVNRYTYSLNDDTIEIGGYYFYNELNGDVDCNLNPQLKSTWHFAGESKQRVIDRFVITEPSLDLTFTLSVLPFDGDVLVKINGIEQEKGTNYSLQNDILTINDQLSVGAVIEAFTYHREKSTETFVASTNQKTWILAQTPSYDDITILKNGSPTSDFRLSGRIITFVPPLVLNDEIVIKYTSSDNLIDSARGYYEIPSSLENNPNNLEVGEHSYNDFVQHFISIIENQENILSATLGSKNLYRDSEKDLTKGEFILQNRSSVLKSMLISGGEDLDLIKSIRFASQEYTRFKNKFAKTVKDMLDKSQFQMIADFNNNVLKDAWFNEVMSRVVSSSEVKSTFLYSHMIATGTVYQEENLDDYLTSASDNVIEILPNGDVKVKLENFVDLSNPQNVLYLFLQDSTIMGIGGEKILAVDKDYDLDFTDSEIIVTLRDNVLSSLVLPPTTLTLTFSGDTIVRDSGNWVSDGLQAGNLISINGTTHNDGIYRIIGVSATTLTVQAMTDPSLLEEIDTICSYYGPVFSSSSSVFETENLVLSTVSVVDVFSDINVFARLYSNPAPTHIPATPSKLGLYGVFCPRIEIDETFPTPANSQNQGFIIGHDGSRTPVYGDLRDEMILELEKRIYNGIDPKFRSQYEPPISIQDVVPGKFRDTNYTQEEINLIQRQSFFKWANTNRVDPRANEFFDLNDDWTYNFRGYGLNETNTPGYWRGIFNFYYDTDTPHMSPWKMLGFSEKPEWWGATTDTGDGFTGYGTDYSSLNLLMWNDLEQGRIRRGPRQTLSSEKYARPGLVAEFLPVDSSGNIKHPAAIGLVSIPSVDQELSRDWKYGDGGPVEDAWKNTSSYPYSVIELLYLTKPGKFSDRMWDTKDQVQSQANPNQWISPETCKRRKNFELDVHGEMNDDQVVIKFGYQQWISDRLLFNRKNIRKIFGDAVRSLNVKLGHKIGGFSNNETLKIFAESLGATTSSSTNLIPSENVALTLFKGPSTKEYIYSGVIVKARSDGRYQIYGYDLIENSFKFNPRAHTSPEFEINVAGKSVDFRIFQYGVEYKKNDIVKFNNQFFRALETHVADTFDNDLWRKLPRLPVNGGVEVTHYPQRDRSNTQTIDYGTILEDIQDVFDFLIGYGDYLESQGWIFDEYDPNTNTLKNFLESGRKFLFWVATAWSQDNAITLSPSASGPKLQVEFGYPANVERTTNGVYSILDERGVIVDPRLTTINRDDRQIQVVPKNESIQIYYFRASVQVTEHIIVLDNLTSFNDVIYDSLLNSRQLKVQFSGFRTLNWFGKYEAPGYMIKDDQVLIPNFENTTSSIRDYHNTEVTLDNSVVEDAARHLIGFEEKDFLVDLDISEDTQYQFYQGMIREKGTQESIKKLLRSTYVRREQDINVYEEWALKVSEFGATCENQRMDVKIHANEVKTDPQLVIFDSNRSVTKFVKSISIVNAQEIYSSAPSVQIVAKPEDPNISSIENAEARAVISNSGKLLRIDVVKSGSGYTLIPDVVISPPSGKVTNADIAIAVLNSKITKDITTDDTLVIDIDDPTRWVYRPRDCDLRDLWPTTSVINYDIPNAGYVHINDIDYTAFDIDQLLALWDGSTTPGIQQTAIYNEITDEVEWTNGKSDTIWVAKNPTEDWAVYEIFSYGSGFFIDQDEGGFFMETGFEINVSENNQRILPGFVILNQRRATSNVPLVLEIDNLFVRVVQSDDAPTTLSFRYEFVDDNGEPFELAEDIEDLFVEEIWGLRNIRFDDTLSRDSTLTSPDDGDISWIDDNGSGLWETQVYDNSITSWKTKQVEYIVNGKTQIVQRRQDLLVDTHKFKQAFVYDSDTEKTIHMLPIYDPFKGLLPGIADQNITFKTHTDPARYTNSNEPSLINPSEIFGREMIGRTWLDLSNLRYMYYEQGTNKERRNQWGRLFPGSTVLVYEWTRSLTPPLSYTGEGDVRNTTDYVAIREFDEASQRDITAYYFWVRAKSSVPSSIPSRTISTTAIELLLTNPRKQNFQWISPINYHHIDENGCEIKNALIFNNINRDITNRSTVIQLNYKHISKDTKVHTEWYLVRENDIRSEILDQHWNKMVDSTVGLTKLIKNDIIDSSMSGYIPVTANTGHLIVPDPSLSDVEKYGNNYRPRQSWFRNIREARRVFVEKANSLLIDICLRDENPEWNSGLPTNSLWEWVTWYADGWSRQNAIPTRQVKTVTEMTTLVGLSDGQIIKVSDSSDPNNLFSLFVYNSENDTFDLIAREACALQLKNSIYENLNDSSATNITIQLELRAIFEALREIIFILDRSLLRNQLFFAMLNYALSEFDDLDWVFKTTYVLIEQAGQDLVQTPTVVVDPFPSTLDYINTVKPYHTKVRDYSILREAPLELGIGTAIETREMTIKIVYNRVECECLDSEDGCEGEVSEIDIISGCDPSDFIRDARGFGLLSGTAWDVGAWDSHPWDANAFEIRPGIPWDTGGWSTCPWDADALTNYYSGSDPSAIDLYSPIIPDQTINVNVSNINDEILLSFVPNTFEGGPYIFINGKQFFNSIFNQGDNTVSLIDQPSIGDVIEIFNVLPFDGNGFLQPGVKAGIPEELAPITIHENLVMVVDTNPIKRFEECDVLLGKLKYYLPFGISLNLFISIDTSQISVFIDGVLATAGIDYNVVSDINGLHPWDSTAWDGDNCDANWDATLVITFAASSLVNVNKIQICYQLEATNPRYSHTLHFDVFGNQTIYRNCDAYSAKLANTLNISDDSIVLNNEGAIGIKDADYDNPGYIWIDSELIEYRSKSTDLFGNIVLNSIVRGKNGTIVKPFIPSGKKAFDASNANVVQNIDQYSTIGDLTPEQIDFLVDCPGTAIENICDP